jgi:uncharacterized protein (TIGR00725 family)
VSEAAARRRVAAIFGSARLRPGSAEYEEVRRLGALLARTGWTVQTGGYEGAMAAASEGAHAEGGHVVGVTVAGWSARLRANPWVREERAAEGLAARLEGLLEADAWLAVAGGVGTLSEVAVAWNLLQIGDVAPRSLILVGPRWQALVPHLRRHLVMEDRDVDLLRLADDAGAAVGMLADAVNPRERA